MRFTGGISRASPTTTSWSSRHLDRNRIFNLGYYTWVEQQGVSIEDFDSRRKQDFWQKLVDTIPAWDRLIEDFNAEIGRNAPA